MFLFVPTPESQTFRKCLKGMAGTTRLELATSAVTVQRPEVTSCNFTAPIATFGALGNPPELLLHPNCTHISICRHRESLEVFHKHRYCVSRRFLSAMALLYTPKRSVFLRIVGPLTRRVCRKRENPCRRKR